MSRSSRPWRWAPWPEPKAPEVPGRPWPLRLARPPTKEKKAQPRNIRKQQIAPKKKPQPRPCSGRFCSRKSSTHAGLRTERTGKVRSGRWALSALIFSSPDPHTAPLKPRKASNRSSSSLESVSHSIQILLVAPAPAPTPPPSAPSAAPSSAPPAAVAAATSRPRASSWASGTFFFFFFFSFFFFFFCIFSNFFLSFSFFFSSFLLCSSSFLSIFRRSFSVSNFSEDASCSGFLGGFSVSPFFRGARGSASAAATAAASAATSAAANAVFLSLSTAQALIFMAIFSMVARPPRGAWLSPGPGALLAPGLGLAGPRAPRVGGIGCDPRCAAPGPRSAAAGLRSGCWAGCLRVSAKKG
uniref:Uncharacterized protein LOC109551328 n=1 Tax=Tursiops truncatus TaxID=9739 RepID=A0A6J3Q488_TURTR|nr:uncharacterized protein LOC109551328 [Tursiops truncatus]